MKTILITLSIAALTLSSCKKSELITLIPPSFASPIVKASEYSSPFVGALEIYPTSVATDTYIGNYVGNPPMVRTHPATYIIGLDGVVQANPRLLLPIGSYTLVYWGVPYDADTTYKEPQAISPNLSIGANLGNLTVSLRQQPSDTTYSPTYDYVYALRNIEIGRDSIDVPLRRVVAGVRVVARNGDGSPLSQAITSITAQVGGVSSSLNFFTAAEQGNRVTLAFPLTIANDRMSASNLTVTTFPSIPNPPLTLIITLANGTQHVLRTTLANTLTANNRLTIDLNLNQITSPSDGGTGFVVSQWTETSEQITI